MIIKILFLSVFYAVFGWWKRSTAAGRGFEHYIQNWRVDWISGVGIALIIVLGPMVLVVLLHDWGILH